MSYSIMDMGNSTKGQSKGSLNTLVEMEKNREIANDATEQQKKTSQMSGVASGAMIGFTMGGPVGAGVGAVIGLTAGSL